MGEAAVGANDRKQSDKEERREQVRNKKGLSAEWRGYINVELSADEKAQFDEWMRGSDPWDVLQEVVASGCVVTIKLNAGSTGFLGSVTQRETSSVNAGLAVTARSSDATKALFRAMFLVAKLGVHADWAASQGVADPDRW